MTDEYMLSMLQTMAIKLDRTINDVIDNRITKFTYIDIRDVEDGATYVVDKISEMLELMENDG